ncbi:peptidoglycan recognition protein [Streptomyces sp. ISL-96]|uniref:peptidoglycan recognition protein family protein n=1 Tax=Streptomyces sp. ISL-96 TaxID=2819191 RepID=UPI001BE6DCCB|nr:peptidoglycan recognition protein [Streptomyces sp. ISL-96]MBT2493318.1 peptidoglycan recognition protein [Streptomyces sp. ISL-96]
MRAFLASAIGVACTAALVLPTAANAAPAPAVPTNTAPPGSTQSLPLVPLPPHNDPGTDRAAGTAPQGRSERDTRPFSLVGVVWEDAEAELHGTVQVRTRATATGAWTGWQYLETHNHEHAADSGTAERETGKVRGSTAPLWVGDSDGVEVQVRPEGAAALRGATPLPSGLRLELVDPGDDPPAGTSATATEAEAAGETVGEAADSNADNNADDTAAQAATGYDADDPRTTVMTAEDAAASAVNADLAPLGATEVPALSKAETEEQTFVLGGGKPRIGPRPRIVTRKGWGANEQLRERNFVYTHRVKAAFVHHSATGNNYSCSQADSVLRSIYRYHVKSSGWRDFGYNFAVDKCGNIYEGRAGGVAKPVLGAHTRGFNSNSTGIAVLGSYSKVNPPAAVVNAVARLTAWKLGLYGANPRATTTLKSGGGNRYKKGTIAKLKVISGHRDGYATDCPGGRLYSKLDEARDASARLQGR